MTPHLTLHLHQQRLVTDERGYRRWEAVDSVRELPAEKVALVLCDVWDRHWCRGAVERLEKLLPRMNAAVTSARAQGVLIVHAPSDTMAAYQNSPARQRVLDVPPVEPPLELAHADPPLPVDDADGGCDSEGNGGDVDQQVWTREHPAIGIDHERDAISDNGLELLGLYRQRGIEQVLIAGVHTNMCVLNRSFAIKQMVRWGMPVALLRDLTDALYNPACRPYVSQQEGMRLVIEYIEKVWCPTTTSDDLAMP